jgi:hypothetical protein
MIPFSMKQIKIQKVYLMQNKVIGCRKTLNGGRATRSPLFSNTQNSDFQILKNPNQNSRDIQ